jgi:uncharacterized membrane protein
VSLPSPDEKETGRLEAFSDGVFAIAITLLVLEIKVPREVEAGRLAGALLEQWPSYLAFLTSFSFIGIMWINHHRMFRLIRRSDHGLLLLNGLLLLGVTFVPFPTALVADYLHHPDEYVAAIAFSGTYLVIGIFFNLLSWYAYRRGLFAANVDAQGAGPITRAYLLGTLLYLAAVGLALVNATASLVFNLALAVFFALPRGEPT